MENPQQSPEPGARNHSQESGFQCPEPTSQFSPEHEGVEEMSEGAASHHPNNTQLLESTSAPPDSLQSHQPASTESVAESPWVRMGTEDILAGVLARVSRTRLGGGFAHALVCREWAKASPAVQRAVRVRELSEHGLPLPPGVLLQELRAFPNLTSLDVPRWAVDCTSAGNLAALARDLGPHLESLRFEDSLGFLIQRPTAEEPPGRATSEEAPGGPTAGAVGAGTGAGAQCSTSDVLNALLRDCPRLQCLELPELAGTLELQEDALLACAKRGHLRTLVLSPWHWSTRNREETFCFPEHGFTTGLLSVPSSLGPLLSSSLRRLALHSNTLHLLPDSFCELSRLQDLGLYCPTLEALPNSFGDLEALASLWLSSFQMLRLPDSFRRLGSLQHLLLKCPKLEALPPGFESLSRLRVLAWRYMSLRVDVATLQGMHGLTRLEPYSGFPEAVAGHDLSSWRSLKSIVMDHSDTAMLQIPEEIWSLPCLEELELPPYCPTDRQKRLQGDIGRLSSLKRLAICSCKWVHPPPLEKLSILEKLVIEHCCEIRELPEDLGQLKALQHLRLRWLEKLQCIPESLGNLSALRHLELDRLSSLRVLPDSLGELALLTSLCVTSCYKLHVLSIIGLQNLEELKVEQCSKLKEIVVGGFLGTATALRSVELLCLPLLVRVPDSLSTLPGLASLVVFRCPRAMKRKDMPERLRALISKTKSPYHKRMLLVRDQEFRDEDCWKTGLEGEELTKALLLRQDEARSCFEDFDGKEGNDGEEGEESAEDDDSE